MRYVKYMPCHYITSASRNRREIAAAAEYGYEITVFSSDREKDDGLPAGTTMVFDGRLVAKAGTPGWRKLPQRAVSVFRIFFRTLRLQGDVWSCHNLFALGCAWFATRFRRKRPKIIYDSHEFGLGLYPEDKKFKIFCMKLAEGFFIRRCTFTIIPCEPVADELQRIYGLPERPVVVRSTPYKWELDEKASAEIRKQWREALGEPKTLIMYHGMLFVEERSIETMIDAVARMKDVGFVIMGNALDPSVEEGFRRQAREAGVSDRILFHPAVPLSVLKDYVSAVDVEMALTTTKIKNGFYSLPNKFFESIQSLTPMIVSDGGSMRRIVEEYDIGLWCEPKDPEQLCECVRKMGDPETYARFKRNLLRAKDDLCWESEKHCLFEAWDKYCR